METKYNYAQLKQTYEVRLENEVVDLKAQTHDIYISQLGIFESEFCAVSFALDYVNKFGYKQTIPVKVRESGILAKFANNDYTLVIARIGCGIPVSIEEDTARA